MRTVRQSYLRVLLGGCLLLCAATVKLYMKDGSYQLVREYQLENDRVRFFSTDRGEWEEVPASLVDLQKTKTEIKQREDSAREDATATGRRREGRAGGASVRSSEFPLSNGVYLIEGDKLIPVKVGESKVVSNKRRTVLKVLSPMPMVSGKARWRWMARMRRRAPPIARRNSIFVFPQMSASASFAWASTRATAWWKSSRFCRW